MFQRKPLDFWMVTPIILLSLIGLIMISSVSPENLASHVVYLLISFIVYLFVLNLDRAIFYSLNKYLYLVSVVGLLLPFLFGTITRGSVRWISLGLFTVQPSEIAKPLLAIFSAVFLSKNDRLDGRDLIVYLSLSTLAIVLVLLQPDLGSALVLSMGIVASVLISKIKKTHLLVILGVALMVVPVAWFGLHDYQRDRVSNFINPYRDPLGTGYNAIQAQISVGSGGVLGRGLGKGTQSHLAFLPERYTDFIFASYAEETGFIGSLLMIVIYLVLFLRIISLSLKVGNLTDRILVSSLLTMLFFQTMVNLGMNIGIMPIAGVTLPLVSYGGSSIITTMFELGFISNVLSRIDKRDTLMFQRRPNNFL